MKLHDAQKKFEAQAKLLHIEDHISPTSETAQLLNAEWPAAETTKRFKARIKSLSNSNDGFPMHLIMLRADIITKICKTDINPVAHIKVMRVAGKTEMVYIDDLVVRKVCKFPPINFGFFCDRLYLISFKGYLNTYNHRMPFICDI